jgi:trehalose-phosphatase
MDILNRQIDLEAFFKRLQTDQSLLILDYDGTLAPFTLDPKKAIPYAGVKERLTSITRHRDTRVVIISGRALSDLIDLIDLDPLPEMWGSHGAERLTAVDRVYSLHALNPGIQEGLDQALEIARKLAPSYYLEEKPVSAAIHWRGFDEASVREVSAKIEGAWKSIAKGNALELHFFDGGIEIRPAGVNKGIAIQTLLEEVSDAVIAYLGDDLTDEEAFSLLGERGLKVLVRSELRSTIADLRLIPPQELLEFLERWEQNLQ